MTMRQVGARAVFVMIVRHFIQWVRTAPTNERAEATRALARAYLTSDLAFADRQAAEGALLMMLDDPSPLVREALAWALARSAQAPAAVVQALSRDQPCVALPVLEFSPLLIDADLVDVVATGNDRVQSAIARRAHLAPAVCGALAEVGSATAVRALIENCTACIVPLSWERMVERLGHDPQVREALLEVEALPPAIRIDLAAKLAKALTRFVVAKNWLSADRAAQTVDDALARATVDTAAAADRSDMAALLSHLRLSGLLTGGLLLRALLSGNTDFVAHALAELTDLPVARTASLLQAGGLGLEALLVQAGLPPSVYPAFAAAAHSPDELAVISNVGGHSRLLRRTCERALAACQNDPHSGDDALLVLLRQLTTESRREEARLFCDELAGLHEAWQSERLAA